MVKYRVYLTATERAELKAMVSRAKAKLPTYKRHMCY